jgi:hypothetical protein
MQTLFRRQIALPQDHRSWVFLFSPLLIGLLAGKTFSPAAGAKPVAIGTRQLIVSTLFTILFIITWR